MLAILALTSVFTALAIWSVIWFNSEGESND